MTFSSIRLIFHDCHLEGNFYNYACSSISSQGWLFIIIPHLLDGYHPILPTPELSATLPFNMPELTSTKILFSSSILRPASP